MLSSFFVHVKGILYNFKWFKIFYKADIIVRVVLGRVRVRAQSVMAFVGSLTQHNDPVCVTSYLV